MKTLPLSFALLVFFLFPAFSPLHGAEESEERIRSLQKELERTRASLHEAQRELAAKADRIAELESRLDSVASKGRVNSPMVRPPSKREQASAKESSKRRSEEKKKVVRKEAAPVRARPVKKPFVVSYDENSAVNYEAREAALKWVRGQLKEDETRTFTIVAFANDSEYAETNRDIAMNRGQYLADYLILNGVRKESIGSIDSDFGGKAGAAGRQCLISASKE
jgi:outer membrane protein OmpA-like peptidoglycan-associated protein